MRAYEKDRVVSQPQVDCQKRNCVYLSIDPQRVLLQEWSHLVVGAAFKAVDGEIRRESITPLLR